MVETSALSKTVQGPACLPTLAREKAQRIWEKVRHALWVADERDYGGAEFTSFCQSHTLNSQLYGLWYRSAAAQRSETAAAQLAPQLRTPTRRQLTRKTAKRALRSSGVGTQGCSWTGADATCERHDGP